MTFLFIHAVDFLSFSLFLYLFVAFRDHRRRRGLSYPPGPPPRPMIGNLLDVPKEAPWIAYADMTKRYGRGNTLVMSPHIQAEYALQGDVICLRVLGQVVVVLCSLSAIKDLLEKRGEAYADRPTLPILEMCAPFISDSFAMSDSATLVFQNGNGLVVA